MKKILSIISYIVAIIFLIFYIYIAMTPYISISEFGRLFLLCGSCIFLYIGGVYWSKYKKNNKIMKINLWIFFSLYLILFITLTLFDPMWGRNGFNILNWSTDKLKYYLKDSVNLIPFATIIKYIKSFNSLQSTRKIMFNLLGNFVACMPIAFFLPLLFKKQNNLKIFLFTITIIVLSIELTQVITFSGKFDIDDLILNISGALLFYIIMKIKLVNNIIRNIFLLEKINLKEKKL